MYNKKIFFYVTLLIVVMILAVCTPILTVEFPIFCGVSGGGGWEGPKVKTTDKVWVEYLNNETLSREEKCEGTTCTTYTCRYKGIVDAKSLPKPSLADAELRDNLSNLSIK